MPDSVVNVYPRQRRLADVLRHADKLPAIALIKTGLIGDQIQGRNALGAHIPHSQIEQPPGDSLTAIACLCIHRADIRLQVLAIMEVIFDDPQPSNNLLAVQAQISAVFRFPFQISRHAFQIGLLRNIPFFVEPG